MKVELLFFVEVMSKLVSANKYSFLNIEVSTADYGLLILAKNSGSHSILLGLRLVS